MHILCSNESVTAELLQCMHTLNPDAAMEKGEVSCQRYSYTDLYAMIVFSVRCGIDGGECMMG